MGNTMKVLGRRTKCMEMELFNGKMERDTKETLSMISAKVTENSFGKMAGCTKVSGKMASNTVEVNSSAKTERRSKESGRMAEKLDGCNEVIKKTQIILEISDSILSNICLKLRVSSVTGSRSLIFCEINRRISNINSTSIFNDLIENLTY